MPATLDVDRFIDQNRLGPFHAVLLTLCFLVMFADGYDLAALSYIAPALMEQWGLSKPQLGQALSAALFGLAGGAIFGVLAGAELMRQQIPPDWIFNALLLPAIIIAIALLLKRRRYATGCVAPETQARAQ